MLARVNRPTALLVLLALLAAGSAARLMRHGFTERGVDFYQVWAVVRSLHADAVSPPAALYSPEAARALGEQGAAFARGPEGSERQRRAAAWFRVLQPTGTPLFYTLLRPLAWVRYESAYT